MVIGDVSASKSFQMVCHSIDNYLWNLTSCSSITEGNTIFLLLDNIGKIVLPLEFVFLLLFIGSSLEPPSSKKKQFFSGQPLLGGEELSRAELIEGEISGFRDKM